MGITLIAESGPLSGRPLHLDEGTHLLGRGTAAIALDEDAFVDSRHAEIRVAEGRAVLRDSKSTHGTYLNGHRVGEAPLHDGDILQVGTTRFRVAAPTKGQPCPGCGLGVDPAADSFCPRCGRDLAPVREGIVAAQAPAPRFCGACGRELPGSTRFCPSCGSEAGAAPPAAPPARAWPRWALPAAAAAAVLAVLLFVGAGVAIGQVVASRTLERAVRAALPAPQSAVDPEAPGVAEPEAAAPESSAARPSVPGTAPTARSAGPSPYTADGRVRLRYGGAPGQQMSYRADSRVAGSINVMGQAMPLNVTASSRYRQEVMSNDGSTLQLRLTMEPWDVSQNGQPFAGALPGAPPPMTVTMDRRGQVTGVGQGGGGELGVPGLPRGLAFDYAAITRQLAAMSFPERALAVGDSWTNETTLPLPEGGAIQLRATSTLEGFETLGGRRIARIGTQLQTPLTMNLSGAEGKPVGTVGELTGKVTTRFDPEEGALMASESDLAMSWTMQDGAVPGLAEAQEALKSLNDVPGLEGLGGLSDQVTLKATGSVRTTVTREE